MRLANSLFVCTLMLGACNHDTGAGVEDGWVVAPKTNCPSGPDMMVTPTPKCAAAKDLPGDNLFCVDFTSLGDLDLSNQGNLPTVLKGWDFTSNCSKTQPGKPYWEIKNKRLVINNLTGLSGTCGFYMPNIDPSTDDFKNHSKFTVSVIQKLTLSRPQQAMGIYLTSPQDIYQIWLNSGTSPRQVSTVTIERTALPAGTNGYQPVFQIAATTFVGMTSVEIESIAVNASQ